jgi:Mor family transcriptional regulator
MQELKDRNKKIYAEKLKGATYKELSIKYFLSMDRIFKIVDREKLRDRYGKDWQNYLVKRRKINKRRIPKE